MKSENKNAIVVSASSDIGIALCKKMKIQGYQITGTYRTQSLEVQELATQQTTLIQCDLANTISVQQACQLLIEAVNSWDIVIFCPGNLNPVGPFCETAFNAWSESITINFTNQLRILHYLLPYRNSKTQLGPCVIFFAGGGSNSAPVNYSAYTASKIALAKMCELLDAEIPDTRFSIVGPGWVKTKIHEATLRAGKYAGENFQKTQDKYALDEWTPMKDVIGCCEWILSCPREVVGGRNFSVVFDPWGEDILETALRTDQNIFKLRRYGNSLFNKRS